MGLAIKREVFSKISFKKFFPKTFFEKRFSTQKNLFKTFLLKGFLIFSEKTFRNFFRSFYIFFENFGKNWFYDFFRKFNLRKLTNFSWNKIGIFEIAIYPESDFKAHRSKFLVKNLAEYYHLKVSNVPIGLYTSELWTIEVGKK